MTPLVWTNWTGPEKGLANLTQELLSWEGTPYSSGQMVKQSGIDCVRLLVSVIVALRKTNPLTIPTLSPDASINNPTKARMVIQYLLDLISPTKLDSNEVQPGDMLVSYTGPEEGHVYIVGFKPGTVWHADNFAGVRFTGIANVGIVKNIYRDPLRESW